MFYRVRVDVRGKFSIKRETNSSRVAVRLNIFKRGMTRTC